MVVVNGSFVAVVGSTLLVISQTRIRLVENRRAS